MLILNLTDIEKPDIAANNQVNNLRGRHTHMCCLPLTNLQHIKFACRRIHFTLLDLVIQSIYL